MERPQSSTPQRQVQALAAAILRYQDWRRRRAELREHLKYQRKIRQRKRAA